tara:strand:- start:6 stop:119 length:114 start_codon:yes stop_codon:yes gene_type:complete
MEMVVSNPAGECVGTVVAFDTVVKIHDPLELVPYLIL